MSGDAADLSPLRMGPPLLGVAALVVLGALLLDLQPRVGDDFFFARSDPALREERAIAERFGSVSQLVVLVEGPAVETPAHLERVRRLTERIASISGVLAVQSLARGPDDLEDARESPLWRRLLLAGDGRTSFVIAEIDAPRAADVVESIEAILREAERPDARLSLAGVPYTVHVMQRQLVRDFTTFSVAAVVAFGLVIAVVFRSGWLLLGMLTTCTGAVAATLLALHALGQGIGLLTANLTTIVFVLAQTHVVFLATNWQGISDDGLDARERVARARERTLRPSLASACTTLLGFGSLLFVPAQPLRELGSGGVIGASVALVAAYLVMPPFLEQARSDRAAPTRLDGLARPGRGRALVVAAGAIVLALGIPLLRTDPSLLAYFDEDGGVHRALASLDESGGSNPLMLVVQREDRARLDSGSSNERLWALHRALEGDPDVGRVVSLPLLVAEARRVPLASLLRERWIVDLIGPETTGAFLTADHRQTLILLQMRESGREAPRSEVIARLEGLAVREGFATRETGGIYQLQARLSDLVSRSLVWSLAALALLFAAVAALAGGSWRVGLAAGAATSLVPLATLGGFGLAAMPLDVIAAPAVSVGFGLAADAALHVIAAWRRLDGSVPARRWRTACREQARGVLRASGIVVLGFGLFGLSSFPPTRRFGIGVAVATAIGALVALWLLPTLAAWLGRRADPEDARARPSSGSR